MSNIVTVLGASGNVGKLLVPFLAAKGYQVRAVGRSLPKFKENNVENIAVDYESQDDLNRVSKDTVATYMLIGLEYKTSVWQQQWPALVERIIESARVTKSKLIFFDNVYAYGLVAGTITEETPMNPETKKGAVRKILDELLLEAIAKKEINTVIAKSADFYGPGITTSVIGDRFFNLILNKDTFEWFGNPEKKHNYTYVNDIPASLEALATSYFTGNIHLPTGKAQTGFEFKELVEKLTGKTLKLSALRQSTAWWLGFFMPILKELHEMMYQSENDYDFSSAKFEKLFPEVKLTSYEQGFKETLAWYSANLKK